MGQTEETTMTTIIEYQSTRSSWSPITSFVPADLAVVGLWSLLGLSFSAALVMSGFAADIGALQAIAW
jgi:hypothetical protein